MIHLEPRNLAALSLFASPSAVAGELLTVSVMSDMPTIDVISFTSSDSQAVLPAPVQMTGFWLTLPVTLNTPGEQTITINGGASTVVLVSAQPEGGWYSPPQLMTPERIMRIHGPREQVIFFPEYVAPVVAPDPETLAADDIWENGPVEQEWTEPVIN